MSILGDIKNNVRFYFEINLNWSNRQKCDEIVKLRGWYIIWKARQVRQCYSSMFQGIFKDNMQFHFLIQQLLEPLNLKHCITYNISAKFENNLSYFLSLQISKTWESKDFPQIKYLSIFNFPCKTRKYIHKLTFNMEVGLHHGNHRQTVFNS